MLWIAQQGGGIAPVRPMSITVRALLLTVCFYILACGIALALLAIVVLEVAVAHRIDLRLDLFCIVGGGLILWSIVPRRVRFTAPGPRLDLASNSRLRQQLEEVAARVGEPMPREVYATFDMNAGPATRRTARRTAPTSTS
jgi:heat shock protein HtpX